MIGTTGSVRANAFLGSNRSLSASSGLRRQTPGDRGLSVRVEANSLNPWGDRSGPEENHGLTDQAFEREVAGSVCKVITAKAVQSVLAQLGETDLIVAQWLNNFAAETSPLLGDEFILKMMRERPQTVMNPSSGTEHTINPQQLGNRVIVTRAELGKTVSEMVPNQMEKRNITLLRKHLTDTSYISGSSERTRGRQSPNYRRGSSEGIARDRREGQ